MKHKTGFFSGCVLGFVIAVFGVSACGGDSIGTDVCPFDECILCENQADCPESMHCPEGGGYCTPNVCTPGESVCENGSVMTCNEIGSGFGAPHECASSVCVDGRCGCSSEADCVEGEECIEGLCECLSSVYCAGSCCGENEECAPHRVCEGDDCRIELACRPICAGTVCGLFGELCCEGDTPECGPAGNCAPSCAGLGELCGENFDECCPSGDFCVFGECRTPGGPCDIFSDCDFGEYCDESIGKCMPDDFPEGIECTREVDFDLFDLEELWHFAGIEHNGLIYENVQSIPVTADMNGSGTPNVAVTVYAGSNQHYAILVVLDGTNGEPIYVNTARVFSGQGHIALGDVTGDGYPEMLVTMGGTNAGAALVKNVVACPDPDADPDGCLLWHVQQGTLSIQMNGMGPLFADLDGNGMVEAIIGTMVIDALSGEILADGTQASRGHNGLANWGSAAAADLDGSGTLEILTGDCAWRLDRDGTGGIGSGALDMLWCNDTFNNGIPAVADIVTTGGRAGLPEVAVVRNGVLRILDGQTGETLYEVNVPGGGAGGPPNIADFDGDGTVEIGLPGADCYTVFDLDCLEGVDAGGLCDHPVFPECTPGIDCLVEPCPDANLEGGVGPGVLWSIRTQDGSMTTGSSVFDFQGNGRNEIVYNDECRLYILDGQTGQPHMMRLNTSRTATEYPLVVDVNGDGRSNLVVIANRDQYNRDCAAWLNPASPSNRPDWFPECFGDGPRPPECDTGTSGVFAFQDTADLWVRTRPIWNQHAYSIDNIMDDGSVPMVQAKSWASHNTFRANRQGERPLNSPDVVVSYLQANTLNCPPHIHLQATIQNLGTAGIPAGLPVSLYNLDGDILLQTVEVQEPILPGGTSVVSFFYEVPAELQNTALNFRVVANDDGENSPVEDCNPDTASATIHDLWCLVVVG